MHLAQAQRQQGPQVSYTRKGPTGKHKPEPVPPLLEQSRFLSLR